MTAAADERGLDIIRRQIRDLTDRAELSELVSRLGLWLDEKRFDDGPSILHEDISVATANGVAQGLEAVVAHARRNHTAEQTQHVITNLVIDLDDDHAVIQANLVATFVPVAATPEAHRMVGERYRFDATRTADGWRLSRIQVIPLWRCVHPVATLDQSQPTE
jgi:hypothetical protein